jgi:hypothetical protein
MEFGRSARMPLRGDRPNGRAHVAVDFTVRIGGTMRLLPEGLEVLKISSTNSVRKNLMARSLRPPTVGGVTPWEVAGIYLAGKALDATTGAIAEGLLYALTDKINSWIRRQQRTRQVVTLYGRDGKPLMVVRRNSVEVTVEKPEGQESSGG